MKFKKIKKFVLILLILLLSNVIAQDYGTTQFNNFAQDSIKQKAQDIAKQVEIYLTLNPTKTILDLQNDSYFVSIAIQKVGKTGYTAITDQDTSEQYFSPQKEMVGTKLEDFKDIIPVLWNFFENELLGKCNEAGIFYDWVDSEGNIRKKYAYSVCVSVKTADGKTLGVDASTYLDEFMAESSKTIKSATELNYPPFSTPTFIEDTADGFSVELLRAALNSVGYNVSFYVGPWSEIKEDLTNEDIDVLPLVGRTPEREKIYDVTVPYITLRGAVFVRQEDINKIKTLDDLKDKEILVMKGDNAEEYAIRNILSSNIISVDSYEDAFDLLGQGKYDAVVVQKLVGLQLIDKSQIKNIVSAFEISDFKQDFTFAVKEGNSKLLTILNEGLSKIKVDGTFDIIYDRWLGDILKSEASSITEQVQLDRITETSIISKSRETALQIDEYLKNNPDKTIKDLQNDIVFQKIAVQEVGEFGYTSVIDVNSGYFYFHPQKQLINTDSHTLKDELPGWWAIFDVTIGDTCKENSGYYDWKEDDGTITEKFMHISCVETKTADNKALFVAATTYLSQKQGEIYVEKYNIDSFSEPKERIKQKAIDVAKQVEIYIKLNPEKTIKDLQNDAYFQEIAVQKIGKTGYTAITDLDTSEQYFSYQKEMIGMKLSDFKEQIPVLWNFFNNQVKGKCSEAELIYEWPDNEGKIKKKYAYNVCIPIRTADGKLLGVDASTYLDEYSIADEKEEFLQAKKAIRTQAENVAKQIEIYLRLNKDATVKDLQANPYFQDIAVQKVGKTGYTAVSDYNSLIARFHANPDIVDLELSSLATKLPGFWDIMKKTKGGKEAEGIYDWKEPDGSIRKKYMYIAIVDGKTADNIGLHVAATTYLDEYDNFDLASIKQEEKLESDILSILSRYSGYTFISIIIIFSILYFLTLSLKEKYKGISSNFKIINILTIIFVISFFTEITALNSLVKLYASRLVHVSALFLVLSLSMISMIVSLKNPIKKKFYVLIYIFFSIVSILILFTGYFEKEIIIDANNPSLSESVFGELYLTYPAMIILIILLPVFFLIRSYIETKSKILLHFIYVYGFFSLLVIFEVILLTILNKDANLLLMIILFFINIGLYWIFLKNKIFYEQKTNILIILIFIGFVFIISIFILNTFQTTKNMRENERIQINNNLQSVVKSRADHVETYLNQNIERFKLITNRTKLKDNINLFNKENKQEYIDIITEILIDAKKPIDEFERLCIINTNGIVIASTDNDFIGKDVRDKEFFMSGLISEKVFLVEENNNLRLFVSGPFILDGEVVGVGLSVVKTDYLNSIMAENTGFGETEEIYIVNNKGYMITPSRFMEFKDLIFKQKIPGDNTKKCWPDNEIDKEDKNNFIVKDYRNITVVNAQSYMQNMDWCLLAEEDYDEAVSVVEKNIKQIWSFTFFMIFLMVIIGIVFSFIITRSLRLQIKEKTSEITNINKNLEKTIHERTKELEELTKNLETKVNQRTSDLKSKVEELEKFQKITVGRELRMIELKKQISELEKKAKRFKYK